MVEPTFLRGSTTVPPVTATDDDVIDAELVEDELEGWDDPAEIPVEVKAAGVVRNRRKGPKWVRKDP